MRKYFLLLLLCPTFLFAQNMELTQELGKTVLYGDIALSPDGERVAWVQSTAAKAKPKPLYLMSVTGNATATRVSLPEENGERVDSDPVWAPDSKTIAFFSTAGEKDDQRQIWTVNADGSNPQKLTTLQGYAARPHWLPNGKEIAFLYIEGAGGGGPLLAAPSTTGVIDTAIHNQRIALLDLATRKVRQVSPGDLHIYDFDCSPDGKTLVASAAPGPGDNNWWIAQIYTVDLANGSALSIYKPSLQVAIPRWSADGKSIAFIEGLMSDEGFHGGDLFTISATGQGLTNRTPKRRSSVSSFFWLTPERVLLTEYVGGGSAISELHLADNSLHTVWQAPEGFHAFGNFPNFALARDSKVAALVRSSFETPPEVWAGPSGKLHQLTHENAGLKPTWGKAENLEWTSEGKKIQGWLIPPAEVASGRKYPLVVLIHGGPAGVTTPDWPASFGMSRAIIAALSKRGYYVFLPNPRGSYGQGEDFTRANVKDFGGGDLRDILAGIDTALKRYPIDPRRLGVTGWSYGGFMTMWTLRRRIVFTPPSPAPGSPTGRVTMARI